MCYVNMCFNLDIWIHVKVIHVMHTFYTDICIKCANAVTAAENAAMADIFFALNKLQVACTNTGVLLMS